MKLPSLPPSEDGCEHSPACLDCPLDVCKFDLEDRGLSLKAALYLSIVNYIRVTGDRVGAAPRFKVSTRTVDRALQRAKPQLIDLTSRPARYKRREPWPTLPANK